VIPKENAKRERHETHSRKSRPDRNHTQNRTSTLNPVQKEGLPKNLWVRFRDEFFAFRPRHGFEKKPLTLPSPPGEGKRGRSPRKGRRKTKKQRETGFPLLGESHHGGFATRKLMKIATPRFVAGLTGVIPGFWEGIFEVG